MHTYESGHSTASKCVHSFLEVSKLFSIWLTFPVNFIHFFGKKSLATFLVSTLSNPLGSGILQWQRISYLLSKVIQSFRLWATKRCGMPQSYLLFLFMHHTFHRNGDYSMPSVLFCHLKPLKPDNFPTEPWLLLFLYVGKK